MATQIPSISFGSGVIVPRSWFKTSAGNELIQVQSDRFLRNWRQTTEIKTYPRFPYLIERFDESWSEFKAFLANEGLGEPNMNQCELSYINYLEPGQGWLDYSELPKVFKILKELPKGFLPSPELFGWESRYKLPEGNGRLHIVAQPALRARDLKLVLSLNLTARGFPGTSSEAGVLAWFGLAHEWIVRGFEELTHGTMHDFWEKQ